MSATPLQSSRQTLSQELDQLTPDSTFCASAGMASSPVFQRSAWHVQRTHRLHGLRRCRQKAGATESSEGTEGPRRLHSKNTWTPFHLHTCSPTSPTTCRASPEMGPSSRCSSSYSKYHRANPACGLQCRNSSSLRRLTTARRSGDR